MSTIFQYSSLSDVVKKESSMLPGQKSRTTNIDTISARVSSVKAEIFDGMLVKIAKDTDGVYRVEPLASGDTADKVLGVVLQDLRAQRKGGSFSFGTSQIITSYYPGTMVSVLTKGYIYVPVQDNGTITAGGKVYIRNAADSANNRPIGGIETATGTGLIELPGAYFTGNYGFPLSSKKDSTTKEGLTAKTAEIIIDLNLKA